MSDLVRVAVDAMGGDYAPVEPVKGAVEAVNADERVKVQLVGQVDVIEKELQKYTTKKLIAAIAMDANMPRVAVAPMKMPSQIKAAIPATGMASAQ